jgi:hypothetical protein
MVILPGRRRRRLELRAAFLIRIFVACHTVPYALLPQGRVDVLQGGH